MTFTIFFATSTGKTEDVADRLKELLPGTEAKDVDNIDSIDELVSAESLICCVPTCLGELKLLNSYYYKPPDKVSAIQRLYQKI